VVFAGGAGFGVKRTMIQGNTFKDAVTAAISLYSFSKVIDLSILGNDLLGQVVDWTQPPSGELIMANNLGWNGP
jgi:hypothetical protein